LYLLDESLHQRHRHRAHHRSPRPATMPNEVPALTPSRRPAAYVVCPDAELKTLSWSSLLPLRNHDQACLHCAKPPQPRSLPATL
jgi:hypothetical protein